MWSFADRKSLMDLEDTDLSTPSSPPILVHGPQWPIQDFPNGAPIPTVGSGRIQPIVWPLQLGIDLLYKIFLKLLIGVEHSFLYNYISYLLPSKIISHCVFEDHDLIIALQIDKVRCDMPGGSRFGRIDWCDVCTLLDGFQQFSLSHL